MRSYVVSDMGYDKFQKRVCQVWASREMARELYEVLLDGKANLLIEALSRKDEGFIEITFTPLADDANVTDIRQVVDIVHEQMPSDEESKASGVSFFSNRIKDMVTSHIRTDVPSLNPPKISESEEPESTTEEEKTPGESTL